MKHTSNADYALRVLLYLRVSPGCRGSTGEMAAAHHVSFNHLDKVVNRLSRAGLVETTRGRGGAASPDPSTITRVLDAYFAVLDDSTLEDIAANDQGLRGALGMIQGVAGT